jgi:uroporphyrinogen-III synthase
MKYVLLTRSEENNKILSDILQNLSFSTYSFPMIKLEALQDKINFIKQNYLGATVIITSNFVANIIARQMSDMSFSAYCIGESSCLILKKSGTKIISTYQNLSEMQKDLSKKSLPNLIYLAGNIISEELNFRHKKEIIYNTTYTQNFTQDLINLFNSDKIKCAAFFSKNTAQAFLTLVNKHKIEIKNLKIICMSWSISDIFLREGFTDVHTSKKPDMESLINILQSSCELRSIS